MSVVESSPAAAAAEADPILRIGSVPDILWSILDFMIIRDSCFDAAADTTPLHVASKHGDLGLVVFLVKVVRVSAEGKNRNGETPLFTAVAKRHYETIRYLVHEARVSLYAGDKMAQDTVLHVAARYFGDAEMVEFLLEKCGMKVDTVNSYGETALHRAAICSNDSVVSWLLETGGASVNKVDKRGETALHKAAKDGRVSTANILLDNRALVDARNQYGRTALYMACKGGREDFCRFLIESESANVHAACPIKEGTLLHVYISRMWYPFASNVTIVKFLIAKGVDVLAVDQWNETALHVAAKQRASLGIIQALVQAGGPRLVHAVGGSYNSKSTALHYAAYKGNLSVVQCLVKGGDGSSDFFDCGKAYVNAANIIGETALHMAAYEDVPLAETLLENGASVDARGRDGATALYTACKYGRVELCRFLVESWRANVHEACPRWYCRTGCTLLHASVGNIAMVKILIEKGVDVRAVDESKGTALHVAVKGNVSLEIIQALVEAGGAELVHAVGGSDKSTALHYAATVGNLSVVQCLVNGGNRSSAFINCANGNGDTALNLVDAADRMDVVKYLTHAKASATTP